MRSWESSCLSLSTAWSAPSVPLNLHAVVDIGTTPSPLPDQFPHGPTAHSPPRVQGRACEENEYISPGPVAFSPSKEILPLTGPAIENTELGRSESRSLAILSSSGQNWSSCATAGVSDGKEPSRAGISGRSP